MLGHVAVFSRMFIICMLFSSSVRIRNSVWFVSGYAHVFVRLSVVIDTLSRAYHMLLRSVAPEGI